MVSGISIVCSLQRPNTCTVEPAMNRHSYEHQPPIGGHSTIF